MLSISLENEQELCVRSNYDAGKHKGIVISKIKDPERFDGVQRLDEFMTKEEIESLEKIVLAYVYKIIVNRL